MPDLPPMTPLPRGGEPIMDGPTPKRGAPPRVGEAGNREVGRTGYLRHAHVHIHTLRLPPKVCDCPNIEGLKVVGGEVKETAGWPGDGTFRLPPSAPEERGRHTTDTQSNRLLH